MPSDHDYNVKEEVDEQDGEEDDDFDSGINSSPVTARTGKSTAVAVRSGLRPRTVRKRCYSSSSSLADEDTANKRRRLAPSTSTGKRGQPKMSISDYDKSMSKNAIAARENREKKKAYIQGLEDKVAKLERDNKRLVQDKEIQDKRIESLASEVSYLRGILSNVDEISSLIRSVKRTPGISSVTTSFGSNLRSKARGHDNENVRPIATSMSGKQPLAPSTSAPSSGVCLHVRNGNVSLEFCAQCNRAAKKTGVK